MKLKTQLGEEGFKCPLVATFLYFYADFEVPYWKVWWKQNFKRFFKKI